MVPPRTTRQERLQRPLRFHKRRERSKSPHLMIPTQVRNQLRLLPRRPLRSQQEKNHQAAIHHPRVKSQLPRRPLIMQLPKRTPAVIVIATALMKVKSQLERPQFTLLSQTNLRSQRRSLAPDPATMIRKQHQRRLKRLQQ